MQATFLKGGTEVGPNRALREELEGLDGEALALRCRRNGLSWAGDREAMTQRLVSLQAYLHGEMPAEAQVARRPRAVEEALPVVRHFSSEAFPVIPPIQGTSCPLVKQRPRAFKEAQ